MKVVDFKKKKIKIPNGREFDNEREYEAYLDGAMDAIMNMDIGLEMFLKNAGIVWEE